MALWKQGALRGEQAASALPGDAAAEEQEEGEGGEAEEEEEEVEEVEEEEEEEGAEAGEETVPKEEPTAQVGKPVAVRQADLPLASYVAAAHWLV